MKNKFVHFITLFSMLASGCSQPGPSNEPGKAVSAQRKESSAWAKYQNLMASENSNIPLAEALTPLFRELSPDTAVRLRQQIEAGQLTFSLNRYSDWALYKRSFIVGSSTASADLELLEKTLNLNLTEVENSRAFSQQLDLKVASLVQSIAYQNLLKAYDDQIKSDSFEIAADVVSRMALDKPELVQRIDRTKSAKDRAQQIEHITIYLKQADYLFLKYKISDSDQQKLILYTAVAGVLANTLAKTETVKSLIQVGREVKDVVVKVNRIIKLTKVIEEQGQTISAHAKVVGHSIQNLYGKFRVLSDELELNQFSLSDQGKASARLLLNDLLNGRAVTEVPKEVSEELKNSGFFEKKRKLDLDVTNFITSADGAAKSLDQIIVAAAEITAALGVKVDPKVTKFMNTALKISKGIQLANAVATGFNAGGFMGAMAAFSGGPATMALAAFGGGLGGGGPDPAVMAELAAIKQSLEEIKAMQREILENQKKMMVMIKDLAIMMEDYHRQEMRALADIHDEVLNSKEALSELDEAPFKSCEAMTSFALNKVPDSLHQLNSSNLDLIKSTIRDVTSTPKTLKQFINNGSSANFKTCQQQMSTVFMTKDMLKFNRAAWVEQDSNGTVIRSGGQITRELYNPAFKYLETITLGKEARWQRLALHLPVLTASTLLHKKANYLNQPGGLSSLADLKYLTATHKLEKFVSALLVLHPYITIDHSVWESSLDNVVAAGTTEEVRERTRQMLVNAFERVQIAIAQEALLAGEPLLPSLSQRWNDLVNEKSKCDGFSEEYFCFVRRNPLMMGNLLTYLLVQRLGFGQDSGEAIKIRRTSYEALLTQKERMAQVLMLPAERLVVDNGKMYFVDSLGRTPLPEVEVVAQGQLQYTEAMARMISLEHKVSDELVKISSAGKTAGAELSAAMFVK